ncbi:MAG: DNA mismatch repair protein MutS [Firmicutes bacterium]|nr:DNA mismatch repair protein MutS [candidate division NPL-UPA2 bacterium]MBT9153504.1 DNA mismatch repair protein MutS [candidate division NPL-UPA2 bacterium]
MSGYTPMLQQYLEIKAEHPHSILFFRLGDFYEMFFEDAKLASRILEITLTAREGGAAGKVPMCGVPYHAADSYVAKLLAAGHTVSICEQTEDPSTARGLVKREVVRTVTPGTHGDCPRDTQNYIVAWRHEGENFALAAVEFTTGSIDIYSGKGNSESVAHELFRLAPREALTPQQELPSSIEQALAHGGALRQRQAGLDLAQTRLLCDIIPACSDIAPLETLALGEIVHYLKQVGISGFGHFTAPRLRAQCQIMALDAVTRRNLELTRTIRQGERTGSLLWVLDHTITAMGSRLLRQWIEQPLTHLPEIELRQAAVEELTGIQVRMALRAALDLVYDLERLQSRIAADVATPRDVVAIAKSLSAVADVSDALADVSCALLSEIRSLLDPHPLLTQQLLCALNDNPPPTARDGGVIREGYNAEIDRLRRLTTDGKGYLVELEAKERAATGIRSLKVGFNRVFGYYLEITKSNLADVPAHYHRKQTLANAERYITEELKQHESVVLSAEERLVALEQQTFTALCGIVAQAAQTIIHVARELARLDALQSFAEAAARYRYVRPQVVSGNSIVIRGGRHPVVERIVGTHAFVPNDTELVKGEIAIITGPNMAGKSTYMRQVALIVLMAQMGSFIPASRAVIGIADRVFTRVGAADDLYGGQSTFMVEMTETAAALREATSNSLLLFDEVGRGTSTYDGMALARAIMEHVHDHVKARTLFSTHYHELTNLADKLERCRNYTVAVLEQNKEITFLRRVILGKASKSYGIHVAELAGLPRRVTDKAYAILKELEQTRHMAREQTCLFDYVAETARTQAEDPRATLALELFNDIQQLNPEALSPLQALTFLYELKRRTLGS